MNKIWLVFALTSIMFGTISCSEEDKKDDEDKGKKTEEISIVGTWTASSGKYDLSLKITASNYNFLLSEPGKGGVTDKGTYEISDEGDVVFVDNQGKPFAAGQLKNKKLSLTFVNYIMIMMLGTDAASNTTFTLSEEENNDETDDDDSFGYLTIQNLSDNYDIVSFKLYDEDGNFLASDLDVLVPDYQFTYEIMTGSYITEITDSRNKSFTSKPFRIIKDKSTVLKYTGSAIEIIATGIAP